MVFVYGHVIWISCMLCVDIVPTCALFRVMHACLSLLISYFVYLYFVLSLITKKGEIEAHLGR